MPLRRQRLTIDRPFFYNLTDFATEILIFYSKQTASIGHVEQNAQGTQMTTRVTEGTRREKALPSINLKNLWLLAVYTANNKF